MAKGFNHALQLAMSAALASGKLFGLTESQIANAVAIAAVDNVSLSCIHSEPVSQWKGFSPALTVMRAVYAASLAKRGFTGPMRLFEGPNDLAACRTEFLQLVFEPAFPRCGGGRRPVGLCGRCD